MNMITSIMAMLPNFLRDLLSQSDDGPLLEHARMVELQHPDQARFIRVQCQLQQLEAEIEQASKQGRDIALETGQIYSQLQEEEKDLLTKHEAEWTAEIRQYPAVRNPRFARGFLDHITLDASDLDAHRAIEDLPHTAPTLGSVSFYLPPGAKAPPDLIEHVLRYLANSGVDRLRLEGEGWGDNAIRTLVGSEHVQKLKSLFLSDCGIGPDGVKAIVQSPQLNQLETLDLAGNSLSENGFSALAEFSLALPALRHLDLSNTGMLNEEAQSLAGIPGLSQLSVLDIGDNPLSTDGVLAFVQPGRLPNTRIDFDSEDLPYHVRGTVESRLNQHNGIQDPSASGRKR